MDNYVDLPESGGGGSGGVTSLNSLMGVINLIGGPGITITEVGQNIEITSTDLPTAIISINGDTFANQTLVVGTGGTDFNIADTGGGVHVFNLPTASATNRGALSSADWTTFNNKQGALSIGNLDAQAANAKGLALVSNVLSTQSATASFPGMVNTVQQTFGGNKTFSSIGINDTSASAGLFIFSPAIGTPSQIIKGIAGQTANLFELVNSAGLIQVQFTAGGNWQMYNTAAVTEARIDLRPSVEIANINVGAAARYSIFVGDPDNPEAGGQGGGIAFGGVQDNISTATEFGYIWTTKNNNTAGNIDASMHFATRNNASGNAQRVLDMDQNGNSFFWGNVSLQGSTSGAFTQAAPATVTSYTVTWPSAQGAANSVLQNNGSGILSWATPGSGGIGTVTSVALALPAGVFTVSGSPVTSSGTLTGSFNTQSANSVFAGPTTGAASAPTFRALVSADIPAINLAASGNGGVTGILPVANGGTNNSSSYTAGSIIFSNGTSLTQDNANFFWNDTNQSIGIGTNTPASNAFLDGVNVSLAAKRLQLTGFGVGSTVGYRGRFARGSLGSPAAVQAGDILTFFSGQGYGASTFPSASTGAINITAGETFTNSSNLTYMAFNTTPTGSVTSAEAFRVATAGVTLGPQSGSTAIHNINGGLNRTNKTITANYAVDTTTTDDIISCNAAGAITVTLPTPTNGRTLVIKDISGAATTNNVTIARHASENIEGVAASYLIQVSYGTVILYSDGTNWWIIG